MSQGQELLTLVARGRHLEPLGTSGYTSGASLPTAEERAVEIVAMRQVDDHRARPLRAVERLNREFLEGGTLRQRAPTLHLDDKTRSGPSDSEHRSLR